MKYPKKSPLGKGYAISNYCFSIVVLWLAPQILLGQSMGPTAPEYTSFEPISASDPVQIETGDFTYQIPLMTIPGPEGGFPISIHYHAGIQPEQESSWVGLGWNLNVGAINRYVNLFPDDLKAEIDESYTFWEGGQTKVTKSIIKFPQIIPYTEKRTDTFKGSSSFTVSRYHQSSNINGFKSFNLNAEQLIWDAFAIGLFDFKVSQQELQSFLKSQLTSPIRNYVFQSLEKVSRSSDGEQSSAGSQSRSTSNSDVSQRSSESVRLNAGKAAKLGAGGAVLLGYGGMLLGILLSIEEEEVTRYWIDDREYTAQTGSLNRLPPDRDDYFNVFDANNVPLLQDTDYVTDENGSIASLGGILPSFDTYQVLSPSVGGTITPNTFERYNLFTGNFLDQIIYEEIDTLDKQPLGFRYYGDFSNYFNLSDPTASLYTKPSYDANYPVDFFDDGAKRLAAGRHIEWFTNAEINNGTAAGKGFMAWDAGSDREFLKYGSTVEQKIGGFMITDENGVTYHFSLPVYTYENFQRFEQIAPPQDKKMYKHSYIPAAYAYTWLLTGITGPGYRNTYSEGLGTPGLDEEDNGYWVRFDYGLWTTQHKWRTPFEGYEEDVDGEYHYFSRGKKELYYLDKIVTRSHTAVFVKEMRRDGKGISQPYVFEYTDVNGNVRTTGEYNAKNAPYLRDNGDPVNGGFSDDIEISWSENGNDYKLSGVFKPTATLRLKDIVLFKNDRLRDLLDDNQVENRNLAAAGDVGNHTISDPTTYALFENNVEVLSPAVKQSIFQDLGLQVPLDYHLADNVIDVDDIASFEEAFYNASLSSVNFQADYSLMDDTPNSLLNDQLYDEYTPYSSRLNATERFGKLSLKGLQYRGRGGEIDLPPTLFSYKHNTLPFPGFQLNGVTYTKKDNWGFYHHQLNQSIFAENRPFARVQTNTSAQWKDAWSLARIKTATGANLVLDYEPDTYTQDLVKANVSIPLANMLEGTDTLFFDFATSAAYRSRLQSELGIQDKYNISITLNLVFKGFSSMSVCDGPSYTFINKGVIPYYRVYDIELEASDFGINAQGKLFITGAQLRNQLAYLFDDLMIELSYRCEEDDYLLCIPANSCPCPPGTTCEQIPISGISMAQGSLNLGLRNEWLVTNPQPGGGIRLKSVAITDGEIDEKTLIKTVYDYHDGLTSYDPHELAYSAEYEVTIENTLPNEAFDKQEESKESFKMKAIGERGNLLAWNSLVPSPTVTYGKVGIRQVNTKDPGQYLVKEEFQFTQPGKEKRFQKIENIRFQAARTFPVIGGSPSDTLGGEISVVKMIDLNATAGLLKHHRRYDGTDALIFSHTNHYLHEQVQPRDDYFTAYDSLLGALHIPGRLDQQYYTQRRVIQNPGEEEYMQMIVTEKERYPSVLVREETIDHLYNMRTEVRYDSFDILTGQVRKTLETDSYGEQYLQKTMPAYSLSSNAGMGSKFFNIQNANMLSADLQYETVRVKENDLGELNEVEIVGASASQWSNSLEGNPGIWQPEGSFEWAPQNDLPPPVQPLGMDASSWKLVTMTNKVDTDARVLESEDINGITSVVKMNLNEEHVLLEAVNAGYGEVAFSSAEYFDAVRNGEDGGVTRDTRSIIAAGVAHSGWYSLGVGYLRGAFQYTLKQQDIVPGRTYRVSVWVYMPGFAENELENAILRIESNGTLISEAHPEERKKSKEWYLIEAFVTADGAGDIEISCTNQYPFEGRLIYFDDFRVQPVNAVMSCYVYDNTTDEVTHIFDNNHFYVRYEYDKQGRLRKTYREIFHPVDQLLSEQTMNYKN